MTKLCDLAPLREISSPNKIIANQIRFYQRFRFSESVKSASNFDADKTDLLCENADKNGFL